jgi:transcriptional regulator with XRE-family HTH domain
MDNHSEVRDFLTSRRARLTPEQAGLPRYGANPRVKGLRREEVALLAGVSVDYYTRLERGYLAGVSDSVLDALADGLQLDESECTHLFDLARTANASGPRRRTAADRGQVREGVMRLLNAISTPAYIRNDRLDLLGANRLGHALLAEIFDRAPGRANMARYLFLDDRSHEFYTEWDKVARDVVAALRITAGKNPHDRALTELVGELSTRSEDFRQWWATHNVRLHRTATKRMHHPVVGDLVLTGEALPLPDDSGLTIIAYTVESNSPTEGALGFLASWAATETNAAAGSRKPT